MNRYHYVACFFAGMFLANTVPHYVKGICGDHFPTPFAKPPGKGLSSPVVNVVWALANLVIGYLLCRVGNIFTGGNIEIIVFFIGVAALSIMCSVNFQNKHAN